MDGGQYFWTWDTFEHEVGCRRASASFSRTPDGKSASLQIQQHWRRPIYPDATTEGNEEQRTGEDDEYARVWSDFHSSISNPIWSVFRTELAASIQRSIWTETPVRHIWKQRNTIQNAPTCGLGWQPRCSKCYRILHMFGSCPAVSRKCNAYTKRGNFEAVFRKNTNSIQA